MLKVIISNAPSVPLNSLLQLCKLFGKISEINKSDTSYSITFLSSKSANSFIKVVKHKIPSIVITKSSLHTVFVDRIPKEVPLSFLKEYFLKYGAIVNIELLREYFTYKVIVIEYEKETSAKTCIECVNRKVRLREDDECLVVKYYDPSHVIVDNKDEKCVFVYNLNNVTQEDLMSHFSLYGDIKNCGVDKNKGFVNYKSVVSALKAVKYANKTELNGNKISVLLKSDKKKKK
ncbi:hypothetical protein H311_01587 [Anncaliia algerae PRA109]|nr:hypothetical protein H311_01587 [Anncaliia algerae PRA109]